MKIEKIILMGIASQLTAIARGNVPPAQAASDPSQAGILPVAQELEDRHTWAMFTEFYVGLQNAVQDETIFKSPSGSLDLTQLGTTLSSGVLQSLVPGNLQPILQAVMGLLKPASASPIIPASPMPPLASAGS